MYSVSGSFSDVAYVGAVEATYFYNLVRAARVHRLPEKLMASSRTAPYFACSDYAHAHRLVAGAKEGKGAAAALLPTVSSAQSTQRRFAPDGSHVVSLVEVRYVTDRLSDLHEIAADCEGVREMWAVALAGLAAGSCSVTYVVYNVDLLVSPHSQLVLSLLVLSFARLVQQCERQADSACRIALCMTVSATHDGRRVADTLQAHLEDACGYAVRRAEGATVRSIALPEAETLRCATHEEWLENVQQWVVDRFEEECEAATEAHEGALRAAVVLVVVPHDKTLRASLRRALGDAYTSEPMRIMEDTQWRSEAFDEHTCVVFLCSREWLQRQAELPRHARLLPLLRVRHIVQGDTQDEAARHLLHLLCPASYDATTLYVTHNWHVRRAERSCGDEETLREECVMTLLLLFRRLLLRYAADTGQPLLTLTRGMLLSEGAWQAVQATMMCMRDAGFLRQASEEATAAGDAVTLELTALGRFASYRFRLTAADAREHAQGQTVRLAHLSLLQCKLVLFAHLFRLPRSTLVDMLVQTSAGACRVAQSRATVQHALASFVNMCGMHGDDASPYSLSQLEVYAKVVRQLAAFSLADETTSGNDVSERLHRLLSAPHGVRTRVMSHDEAPHAARCRGWYDAAPSTDELAVERQPVLVYCLPPRREYCEVATSTSSARYVLQCPLELSIPLLILHSIVHITAHNNCVLLEAIGADTKEEASTMQLPLQLLQSLLFEALLSGGARRGGVGLWLDACMQRQPTLAPSDASLYAPLAYSQARVNGLCERGAAAVRKRQRGADAAGSASVEEKDAFVGVRPRTTVEADAVDEFVRLVQSIGRERAERAFAGKKGFRFLDVAHELHPFYLHRLQHANT